MFGVTAVEERRLLDLIKDRLVIGCESNAKDYWFSGHFNDM